MNRYNSFNNYEIDNIYRGLVLCCYFLSNLRTAHFDDDCYQSINCQGQNNQVARWHHGQNAAAGSPRQSRSSRKKENRRRNAAAAAAAAAAAEADQKQLVESKNIDASNKGFKLMVKMGYESGKGLGKTGDGVLEPIQLQVKNDRKGLGVEKEIKAQQSKGGNAKKKAEKTAAQSIEAEPKPQDTVQRPHFCFKNPATAQQLRAIGYHFRNEIKMLRLRLDAEAAEHTESEEELSIAKIWIEKNQPITSVTFEFIRSEIIGWIGTFQHQKLDTPIFNGMINEQDHIRIVCENLYAYQCLEICITEVAKTPTGRKIFIEHLPTRASQTMYCFDAVYEEIIYDPEIFLEQVNTASPLAIFHRILSVTLIVFYERRYRNFCMWAIDCML